MSETFNESKTKHFSRKIMYVPLARNNIGAYRKRHILEICKSARNGIFAKIPTDDILHRKDMET